MGRGSKCLDVRAEDSYYKIGARVQQYHCTGAKEQLWSLAYIGRSYDGAEIWQLKNKRSGYCLSVADAAPFNGTQIIQERCPTSPVDWAGRGAAFELTLEGITNLGRLDFSFRNHTTRKCLDLAGGAPKDGGRIQQYTCDTRFAQQWLW